LQHTLFALGVGSIQEFYICPQPPQVAEHTTALPIRFVFCRHLDTSTVPPSDRVVEFRKRIGQ